MPSTSARTRLLQLAEAEGARTLGHAHAGVAGSTGPYLLVREPPFGKRISRPSARRRREELARRFGGAGEAR